jgi:hypothetical protein
MTPPRGRIPTAFFNERDMRARVDVQLPRSEDGDFIGSAELRRLFRRMGLEPADMLHTENDQQLLEYWQARAKRLIDRMPSHHNKDEEARRKNQVQQSLLYASVFPNTNTEFVVNLHTNGVIRFRLWDEKLEDLQESCTVLLANFQKYPVVRPSLLEQTSTTNPNARIASHSATGEHASGLLWIWQRIKSLAMREVGLSTKATQRTHLSILGSFKLYEHGLEEPTITGVAILSRWKALRLFALRHIIVAAVCIVAFFVSWASGSSPPKPASNWFEGNLDRFATATLTAAGIALVDIFYVWLWVIPPIRWSWPGQPIHR